MEDCRINELLDWYRDTLREGVFMGAGGGPVRYASQIKRDSGGILVIVPGRAEYLEKYLECARDLQECGYCVCIYDHYGQGGSGRPLEDRQKGHIDDFSIYIDDLHHLFGRLDIVDGSRPVVLVGHSMGGAIAALFSAAFPHLVRGLVLVSPMLQINTGVLLPPFLGRAICAINCRIGRKEDYVFGGGPFDSGLNFANNVLTGDETRFERNLEFVRLNPALALGSPTFGWLHQAYHGMAEIRRRAASITCPILLFQGEKDLVVGLREMNRFCEDTRSCELIRYPEGRHELLMERDSIRRPLIDRIRAFLARMAGNHS